MRHADGTVDYVPSDVKYEVWKKEYVVDKTEKHGIIKGMAANDFEIMRGDGKITTYDPKADYSISVPGLSDGVNGGLSDACRRVARAGSENQCEALELVDLKTGKRRYGELGEYDQVGGEEFWSFIEQHPNDKFAFIHSHPTDGFLSSVDMQTFAGNRQIQMMISTSNDGLKRIAYGDSKKLGVFFDVYYENDFSPLRNGLKDGSLEMVDYRFELEKLKIEKSINEFANLGFWEVDGRV